MRTNPCAQTRAHKPVDGSLTRGAAAQDLASRLQKMFGERVFLSYKVQARCCAPRSAQAVGA